VSTPVDEFSPAFSPAFDPAPVAVPTTWATVVDVRARWADAPLADDVLASMLAAAHVQCLAYAPTLAVGAPVPANYLEAEVIQVRALYQAQERDGDVIGYGGDGYAVRVRPLGQDVKSLLRPRRGVPVIG
jgi:hypothetical protein